MHFWQYKSPIALLAFLFLFCGVLLGPPNCSEQSGFGCFIDKHRRLESQTIPKVILVGGSNVALGMDSTDLERRLRRPVVNMAFGCTVGLRYMLEEVKEAIKPGDVVLVMPEYDFFCTTSRLESNARVNGSCELLNLVHAYPASLKWVISNYDSSPERFVDLIGDAHQLVLGKVKYYERVIPLVLKSKTKEEYLEALKLPPNMYNDRSVYNEHGDVTVHLKKKSPGLNGMEVINYQVYKFNPEGAALIANFGQFASSRGATVFILPPPLPERVYVKWKMRADDIYAHLGRLPNVCALSAPPNFIFPESQFFDTAYHLTAEGRAERTKRVAEALARNATFCQIATK